MHNPRTQQCGNIQREGGLRAGWRWAKWGKIRISIMVLIKKIKKNSSYTEKVIRFLMYTIHGENILSDLLINPGFITGPQHQRKTNVVYIIN